MVASGHKSVVNHLTGNTHSLQIPHPLGENTDTLEAVFTDHYEEYAFLVGCGLSRNSCWLPWFQTSSDSLPQAFAINIFLGHTNPNSNVALMHALTGQCKYFACCPLQGRMGHCLENLWKSEISETTKRGRLKLRGWNPWTTIAEFLFQPSLLSHYNRGLALFILCQFQTIGIEEINGTKISLYVIWFWQPQFSRVYVPCVLLVSLVLINILSLPMARDLPFIHCWHVPSVTKWWFFRHGMQMFLRILLRPLWPCRSANWQAQVLYCPLHQLFLIGRKVGTPMP